MEIKLKVDDEREEQNDLKISTKLDFIIPGIKTPVIESNKPIDAEKEFKKINKKVNNSSQLKLPQVNSPVSQMTPAEKITNTVSEMGQIPVRSSPSFDASIISQSILTN